MGFVFGALRRIALRGEYSPRPSASSRCALQQTQHWMHTMNAAATMPTTKTTVVSSLLFAIKAVIKAVIAARNMPQ